MEQWRDDYRQGKNRGAFNLSTTERISVIQGLSAYRAVNILHFSYKNKSFKVM
jgi:hypothetical protein